MKKMQFVWQYLGKSLAEFKVWLLGYRVYRVRLTQSSTSAPTAEVLENTLGVKATYSYDGIGLYSINFDKELFTVPGGADLVLGNNHMIISAGSIFTAQVAPASKYKLAIETFKGITLDDDVLGSVQDSNLNIIPNVLEIRVYL